MNITISFPSTRAFLSMVLLAFVSLALSPRVTAQALPPEEKAKIEALLSHLAGLSDATFVRNGSAYDAKTAAKFLRKKWEANEDDIVGNIHRSARGLAARGRA